MIFHRLLDSKEHMKELSYGGDKKLGDRYVS